jgi:hypothetical protein
MIQFFLSKFKSQEFRDGVLKTLFFTPILIYAFKVGELGNLRRYSRLIIRAVASSFYGTGRSQKNIFGPDFGAKIAPSFLKMAPPLRGVCVQTVVFWSNLCPCYYAIAGRGPAAPPPLLRPC